MWSTQKKYCGMSRIRHPPKVDPRTRQGTYRCKHLPEIQSQPSLPLLRSGKNSGCLSASKWTLFVTGYFPPYPVNTPLSEQPCSRRWLSSKNTRKAAYCVGTYICTAAHFWVTQQWRPTSVTLNIHDLTLCRKQDHYVVFLLCLHVPSPPLPFSLHLLLSFEAGGKRYALLHVTGPQITIYRRIGNLQ